MKIIDTNGKLWDTDAEVGRVVFYYRGDGNLPTRRTIARITPTQFVLSFGEHVRRNNGRMVDNKFSYAWMPTPEQEAEVADRYEARDVARLLRHVEWSKVPLDTMRAITALLRASGDPGVAEEDKPGGAT